MNESNKTGLIVAFVVVVVLFLIFAGGMMTGWNGGGMMGGWNGGGMMGDGNVGQGGFGGYGWMWIPTLITLGVGLFLRWAIFGKKR